MDKYTYFATYLRALRGVLNFIVRECSSRDVDWFVCLVISVRFMFSDDLWICKGINGICSLKVYFIKLDYKSM